MVSTRPKPAPAPHRLPRLRWRWPVAIVVLSLVLSATLTWAAWSAARVRAEARFQNTVQRTHAAIQARLQLYVAMLQAGAGLFAAVDTVNEDNFRAFADRIDLPENYPGVQGIGFARRVTRADWPVFAEAMRSAGDKAPHLFPEGERAEYFPAVFLEPQDRRNLRALGYDMFSETKRRSAMERARDTGLPAATGRVTLVQEIDPIKQAGFLVYFPVYRGGTAPETLEERREKLIGFVYSPFRAADLLSGILEDVTPSGISFSVHDGDAPSSETLLYRPPEEPAATLRFAQTLSLPIADREWTISYRTTPAFAGRSTATLAIWIALAGLVVSTAIGIIARALARATLSAQERGHEVFVQKEQLRVTLASIGDAVICTDGAGLVSFMNPIAEQLTGWKLHEAKGRLLSSIAPMLNEDTQTPVRSPVDLVLSKGVRVGLANHTVLSTRRGAQIPIEDSAAPIRGEDGELIGVVLVFHDVTGKRLSEDALRERERLLAAVAGGAAVGLAIIRADYAYAFANEAYARAFGLTEARTVEQLAPDVTGPAWPLVKPELDRALAGASVRHELTLPSGAGQPGEERCFAVNYEPHDDAHGTAVIAVMLDITERKRAEENLQASEERRRLAVEAAELGTWDYDPQTGQLLWDNYCKELFGVPDDIEPSYAFFVSMLHPADRNRVLAALGDAIDPDNHDGCDVEYRVTRPSDQAERWVRITGKVYFRPTAPGDTTGTRASRLIGTVQDITETKRKEDALRFLVDLSAATQRLVGPDEIMRKAAHMLGDHLDADRCAYAEVEDETTFVITGDYPRRSPSIVGRWPVAGFGAACERRMRGNQPFVVADSEDDPQVGPADLPAYRATEIRAVICVPLHKAGRFTAAMAVHQARPRRWTDDEVHLAEMVAARCWESLERGRTIRSLQESERRLRFMAESMPQKIFTTRPDGGVDYVNRQWLEFAGGAPDSIRDWNWLEIVHPDDRAENVRRWKHSLETAAPFQFEQRFRRHDGEYRWHLTRANPLRDAGGAISMWIGSNTDITDMVKARETLAERRQELERLVAERTASLREAVEQMEEFSYSISHDLRAPLRAMQGYAQALLEDHGSVLDADGHDYLKRIITASSRMDRLTLDVLTYSKVSREQVQPQRVSLERLVTDCVRQHLDFRDAGADIVIEHPLPEVLGHEPLLMQVVSNLVGNALKFVPHGTPPRIRIHAEERESDVRLWVEDNGIGVPPRLQKRIWGMFERAHHSGGYPGTGIGLAIVRKAVERMGGQVGVESDGQNGSRFWVQLPSPVCGDTTAQAHEISAARHPVS